MEMETHGIRERDLSDLSDLSLTLSLTLRPSQLSTVRFGRGEGVRMRLFHSWL